jgi:4-amino-4-deoxy-L-arabinose transferase-like glycosyltransferase
MPGAPTRTERSTPPRQGAVYPERQSTATIRLWAWAAWAVVVLGFYYVQLWNALWPAPALFEPGGTLASLKGLVAAWANLPLAGEAAFRALWGVFGALLVAGAALPAGQIVCGWLGWRPADWRDEVLYSTAIGLGVIAAGCGLLALAGVFRPLPIQLLVVATLLAGLPRLWTMIRRARWRTPHDAPAEGRRFVRGLQVVSAAALAIAFLTALAPETEYDALWYHLGLPKLWLEAGRPADLVHEYVSLYPLQWDLVFTAGLVFGGPVSAKLLHFICLPLGALLAWQLSRRLAPQAEPWLAVALFLTIPTVLWESTTAYVDLALALHVGLGVLALLRWIDGGGRAWFGLAVLTLGLAMAIKHLALVAVAILAPGLVLWLWRREGWPLARALGPAVLLVVLALLVPLPWYARAWVASGNPFFPELFGIFGASPPERWDHLAERGLTGFKARFGVPRTPMNLLALPWDMTMHAARYGGTLGPLFLLLLPALALFRGAGARLTWMPWFVLFFMAVWASPISSFQLRFLVAVAPVLAVLGAEAARRLTAAAPPAGSKVFAGLLLALLALNLPPFTRFHERDRVGWDGWLTHVIHAVPLDVVLGRQSEGQYLARHIPTYGAWQFVNRATRPDARVMTLRGGDHYYSHRWRIAHVSPVARAAAWQPVGEEPTALRELRALGVTHLLVDRRSFEAGPPETALLSDRMRRDHLDLVYEDPGALVFAIRPDRPGINPQAHL